MQLTALNLNRSSGKTSYHGMIRSYQGMIQLYHDMIRLFQDTQQNYISGS